MSEKSSKIIQWFLYVVMALTVVFGILFYTNTTGNTDLLIYWGYVLGILIIATTVGAVLMNILRNPKGSMKLLVIIAIMALIFILSWVFSTNTLTPAQLEKHEITASTARFVGAGLLILYLLGIGAVLTVIYVSIAKIFK